ncbi:uncharacterized protein LOC143230553 [Tachypleus tridentatus]|uniref:uncharacterized protein LOC143230553 n=1 Tax=Tachypleus tridentatus TaxID=6853 RepID=UPI003FD3F6AA
MISRTHLQIFLNSKTRQEIRVKRDQESGVDSLLYSTTSTNDSTSLEKLGGSPMPNWWREHIQVAPDWAQVSEDLPWMWQLHTYGLACLFLLLACVAFFAILSLRAQLSARPNLSTLNGFLCLLGASRALGLFIDPYGSKEIMPVVMISILWDLAFPCLLSAFSLLQLAFQQMTQVKLAPSRLSNETCVSVVITSHFCLAIASDILWTLQNSLMVVWLVTQVMFTVWGLYLCTAFLCKCFTLLRSLTELPVVFLSQTDWVGYENKGILQLNTLAKHSFPSPNRDPSSNRRKSSTFTPKIRITDENDQTFSYVSDTSQHNSSDLPANVDKHSSACCTISSLMLKHAGDYDTSMGCPRSPKPRKVSSESPSVYRATAIDSSSQCQPLMDGQMKESTSNHYRQSEVEELGPMLPQHIAKSSGYMSRKRDMVPQLSPRSSRHFCQEDFQFDAHKLKPSRRSRVEKLLRKMLLAAILGLTVCVLQVYRIVGPHGLSAGRRNAAVVPWFCYQTLYRVVEFSMGVVLASITRQSLYTHCCHMYTSTGRKRSNSMFT